MNKIDLALEVAARAHRDQVRKGTDIPYIAHPCAVGFILARAGCAEDVVVAGILHDTVEDTDLTLDDIEKDFGSAVADIVKGCSEPDKSLPWEDRKRHTIEFLRHAALEVRLVTCADKLHNVRSILAERQVIGNKVWDRFKQGKELQEWYYRRLVESLSGQDGLLFQAFRNAVDELFSDLKP